MGSRETILKAIQQNKPGEILLEPFTPFITDEENLTTKFQTVLSGIGGGCILVESYEEINALLREDSEKDVFVINSVSELDGYNIDGYKSKSASELQDLQLAVVKGYLGVAENGAVWVTEQSLGNRVLPFICERLILIIEERSIVGTMHEAYERININETGYGVFIAGPSKTADIEQSLVIGAHGPLSLQVYIIKK
jgi:L-lactate dehydrogenase complex protein LldG